MRAAPPPPSGTAPGGRKHDAFAEELELARQALAGTSEQDEAEREKANLIAAIRALADAKPT